MRIDIKHLRTILTIHEAGSVNKAALRLNMTQSALSHQIRYIREQVGVDIFLQGTKPLQLSPAGMELLAAAQRILPELNKLKARFADLQSGQGGRLFIAIECHACFDWLFPTLKLFRTYHQQIDIDIKPGLAFNALPALAKEEVDIVISADPEHLPDIEFHELFSYEPRLIASSEHPLAQKDFVVAEDFKTETVITYPVPQERLDLFSQLLIPAGIAPFAIRQVELTSVILLLAASNKGVSVLPDWVLKESSTQEQQLVSKKLTANGIQRTLYAAVRRKDSNKAFIQTFLELSRNSAIDL